MAYRDVDGLAGRSSLPLSKRAEGGPEANGGRSGWKGRERGICRALAPRV